MSKKKKKIETPMSSPDLSMTGDSDAEFEQMMQAEHLQRVLQDQLQAGGNGADMNEAMAQLTSQMQGAGYGEQMSEAMNQFTGQIQEQLATGLNADGGFKLTLPSNLMNSLNLDDSDDMDGFQMPNIELNMNINQQEQALPPAPRKLSLSKKAQSTRRPASKSMPAKLLKQPGKLAKKPKAQVRLKKEAKINVKKSYQDEDQKAYISSDELDDSDDESDDDSDWQGLDDEDIVDNLGCVLNVILQAWGYEDSKCEGFININEKTIETIRSESVPPPRGLHIVAIIPNSNIPEGYELRKEKFDIWKNENNAYLLSEFIRTLAVGTYILGASGDEISKNISHCRNALRDIGVKSSQVGYRSSLAFIAKKGDPGYAVQKISLRHEGPTRLTGKIKITKQEQIKGTKADLDRLPFSRIELLKGKQNLKSTGNNMKKVTRHRDQLFDTFKVTSHYPLEKIKDLFVIDKYVINKLDLTGVEQLTDMFFRAIKVAHNNSLFLRDVEHINLQGCFHITDLGVLWMSRLFKNLKSVSLNCCPKVTERSLCTLVDNCSSIETIAAKGCDIGILPTPADEELPRGYKLLGCPLVSPPYKVAGDSDTLMGSHTYLRNLREEPIYSTYKAVILKPKDVSTSLIQALTANKLTAQSDFVDFCSKTGMKLSDDCVLNILECSLPYLDLVMSDRTVFILPFNADVKYNFDLHDLVAQILHIKSKMMHSVFVLVGVSQKGSKKLDKFNTQLITSLKESSDVITKYVSNFNQDIFIGQKAVHFAEQIRVGSLYALRDSLVDIDETLHEQLIFTVPEVLSIEGNKGLSAFKDTLIEATRCINGLYPMYTHLPKEFRSMMEAVTRQPGIVRETDFIDQLRNKHAGDFGHAAAVYHKTLQIMHKMGLLMYIPGELGEEGMVITDYDWFTQLIQKLVQIKCRARDLSADILVIHPGTDIMERDKVLQILRESLNPSQIYYFKSMLEEKGLLLEEPNTHDMIMTSDLWNETPVSLEHYKDSRQKVNSLRTSVKIPTRVPSVLWTILLQHVCLIHPPVIIWRAGLVIQDSPVVIFITIKDEAGHSVIDFEVQTAIVGDFPTDEKDKELHEFWKKNATSILGHTLMLYMHPVLYCLYKWNIFCHLEEITGNNVEIPDSNMWSPAIINHRLILNEKTDQMACTLCGMKPQTLTKIWNQHKSMLPSFLTESSLTVTSLQSGGFKGSYVTTNPENGTISPTQNMQPCDFNQIRLVFLNNGGFSISLIQRGKPKAKRELLSISVDDGNIKITTWKVKKIEKNTDNTQSKSLEKSKEIEPSGDCETSANFDFNYKPRTHFDDLTHGDTLLQEADDDWESVTETVVNRRYTVGTAILVKMQQHEHKPEILYSIELSGDVLCKATAPSTEYWTPVIRNNTQITQYIDCSLSPGFNSGALNSWEVGMRLEALDRLNPSLIAVATIAEKNDAGEVKIHFDGWSDKYDYWTKPTDDDLHPVDFMEKVSSDLLSEKNEKLQPPQAYSGPFDWENYLKKVSNYPVPYELFTFEQTQGIKPFDMSHDLQGYLVANCQYQSSGSSSCVSMKNKPANIRQKIEQELSKAASAASTIRKEFPFAVLPRGLNSQFMKYPALKDMWLSNDDTIQLLCNLADRAHIIEHGEVLIPNKKKSSFTDSCIYQMMKFSTMIHLLTLRDQKNFLQDEVKLIVKGVESWKRSLLEEKMCHLFDLLVLLCGSFVALEEFKGIYTRAMSKSVDIKQYPSEIRKLLKDNKTTGPLMVTEGLPQCLIHKQSMSQLTDKGLTTIPMDSFTNNYHLITELNLENNRLADIPDVFFKSFVGLVRLNLTNNELERLPDDISHCVLLEILLLSRNRLSTLPDDIIKLSGVLSYIDISQNPFDNLPSSLYKITTLKELHADHIIMSHLDPDIGRLTELQVLRLAGNIMTELPEELSLLTGLQDLDVSGVRYQPFSGSSLFSLTSLRDWAEEFIVIKQRFKELEQLFRTNDKSGDGTLELQEAQLFNTSLYNMFPRLEQAQANVPALLEKYGCCPPIFFSGEDKVMKFPRLMHLDLSCQGLRCAVGQFSELESLDQLVLVNNPYLESVSGEISTLKKLTSLSLRGCPSLKTPPREIVSKGFKAVFGYLRRINMGSVECKRTKLMMVGLGGAGKTSLTCALRKKAQNSDHSYAGYLLDRYGRETDVITDGIDITDWKIADVTFSMWDFAGQTVYYNTHQFFMSNRAVYLLLWNIRLGYEHAGLDFWLSSIACHAPKAPILVVGSHRDQVEKYWLPEEELRRRYPQIRGFHAISCHTMDGISELSGDIVSVALQEKYMGERIPEAWLNFEKRMLSEKKKFDSLLWEQVETCAVESGIIEKTEVSEAIQFLHELGSVQHFQNHFLKNRVVINPQWIVDAMACVVSVHDTPIKEGRLLHKDIGRVWTKFDSSLHSWLLRLTEEFDLTFPLKNQKVNVVPCLLPAEEPEIKWPEISTQPGSKEMKMLYKFDYLPAGLFNRVQVRLYQFSDSSIIWKHGSLLSKNMHKALLKQKHNNVHLKVQGPRPENIIFMVHEVFEGLMAESFHGVTYDYFVPCSDCVKAMSQDPSLFPASKIRRATELKAPFLQCDKLFHTLCLHELHSIMPPDNSTDYDVHLERSLRDLDNLKDNLSYDIAIVYNNEDIPGIGKEDKMVAPRKIKEDLANNGFKVWFPSDPSQIDLQKDSITLREAKMIIICISNKFVADPHSCRLFYYITKNLQKSYQLVVLGKNYDWKSSDIGMHCTTDVFVNMTDPKRYIHKIKELVDLMKEKANKLKAQEVATEKPQCFISYSWCNSEDARKKGTKAPPQALGYGDPRAFKSYLEEQGIRCWVDVDNVGTGSLFEEIAQGLRHAKVMLVCVSDEYVNSRNCQVEFRFAALTLQMPMVIAVVGTGYNWESTEVGMLSLGFPKINLQYESPNCMTRLLEAVKSQLPEEDQQAFEDKKPSSSSTPTLSPSHNNQLAFQELLELAQRKFLRQVGLYADSMESSPYPRLIVMDLYTPEEKENHVKELKRKQEEEKEEAEKVMKEQEGCCQGAATDRSECTKVDDTKEGDSVPCSETADKSETPAVCDTTPKPHPSSATRERPSSATRRKPVKLLKRKTTSGMDIPEELYAMEQFSEGPEADYCIRVLCEHDEGWHHTTDILPMFPVVTGIMEDIFDDIAPYMARLYAILKHTSLSLPVLDTPRGDSLRKSLVEKCSLESEFHKEYVNWRQSVIESDEKKVMGGLSRCHMPNGKVLWLCPEHQKLERVTVLSDEAADIVGADNMYEDNIVAPDVSSGPPVMPDVPKPGDRSKTPVPKAHTTNKPVPPSSAKPSSDKPRPTRRRSKLSSFMADSNSSSSHNVSNPEAQKAAADIMSNGVKRHGSKACIIM